ncbi:MAG: HDOD domain-containing protein [Rhodoferax sp.]
MTVLLVLLLAVAAFVTLYLFTRSGASGVAARPPDSSQSERRAARRLQRPAAAVASPDVASQQPDMPAELAEFRFFGQDYLSTERRLALVAELRSVPRPPLSLYKLISPEFLDSASSSEISELIMGEALIAAKVLGRVNSAFYGLRRPVVSIGQAVTFLGLNAVRGICLQYMMDESFNSSSPERKKIFDTVMGASALAGELCFKLSLRLELPEQGSLVTQVVLSFLGHLASASLMPHDCILWTAEHGLLDRAGAEQARLGLSATEIGSLLMQEWDLPASLIKDVRDIDRILVTPVGTVEPQRAVRLALCYLCARLGERLALGSVGDLAVFDLTEDSSAEFFHLRRYLELPRLARLSEYLRSPELVKGIHQTQLAMRSR